MLDSREEKKREKKLIFLFIYLGFRGRYRIIIIIYLLDIISIIDFQ